jgi:hypothetical protein
MKNYSIVRVGNEYVVKADEKSVLKIASRRRAAKLVNDAAELLDSESVPQTHTGSSLMIPKSHPILPKFLDDFRRFP